MRANVNPRSKSSTVVSALAGTPRCETTRIMVKAHRRGLTDPVRFSPDETGVVA